MIWVSQEKLDAAILALSELVDTTRDAASGLKVKHPAQHFDGRKWETIICAMIAANGDSPAGIYPERTYLISGLGTGAEKQWPPLN